MSLTNVLAAVDFPSMRKYRVNQLKKMMKAKGVDAVLGATRGEVRYMTDYHTCPELGSDDYTNPALLLVDDDAPTQFVSSTDYWWANERIDWVKEIVPLRQGTNVFFVEELLKPRLEKAGLASGTLALGGRVPQVIANMMKEKLPKMKIVDAAPVMDARMVKSEDEIKLVRIASSILSGATELAVDYIKPGVRECEVTAEVAKYLFAHNADWLPWVPQVLTGGNVAPYLRFHSDRIANRGDPFYYDFGIVYCGYIPTISAFGVVGKKPTSEQKEIYRLDYESTQAALGKLRPGATVGEVFLAGDKVLEDAGAKKTFPEIPGVIENGRQVVPGIVPSPHIIGFYGCGIGTTGHEPPNIGSATSQDKIEKNMVLRLQPQWYKPGPGGGRLKTTIVVRDGKPEVLTNTFEIGARIFDYP